MTDRDNRRPAGALHAPDAPLMSAAEEPGRGIPLPISPSRPPPIGMSIVDRHSRHPCPSFTLAKDDTIASVQSAHRRRGESSRRTMSAVSSDTVVDGRGRARHGRCSCRCCVSSPNTPGTPTSCANRSWTAGPTDKSAARCATTLAAATTHPAIDGPQAPLTSCWYRRWVSRRLVALTPMNAG